MKSPRLTVLALATLLASCASSTDNRGTIGKLKNVDLKLEDVRIEGGIEKAMASYQKFLEETPDSALAPEAIRRLADLKIEKEYGLLEGSGASPRPQLQTTPRASALDAIDRPASLAAGQLQSGDARADLVASHDESQSEFESRASETGAILPVTGGDQSEVGADLENAGAQEAIALYKQLLEKYPHYERNDQVLYQMSRAYEELGEVEEAMLVMNRIASEYPRSSVIDEIQFRRGEYFFTRKKYFDAEQAYSVIVKMGQGSFYYELALYKLGWTFYKQDMHEEALDQFVGLLDYKISLGYDFENPKSDIEQKRIEDTYRVISLSFSALGGADAVSDYFSRKGVRSYEVNIYANLGEHYLEKRRYADAAASYKAFVKLNPYHKVAPHFDMRVIEIFKQGGFPQLVIEANKDFVTDYGLKSQYWKHFDVNAYPEVVELLKSNLKELASYYHALYQDELFAREKPQSFAEANRWYREFLESFPKDGESPVMNYRLADLLLENKSFAQAAVEYERTAYDYPPHDRASAAGYAAVYSHRENLALAGAASRPVVMQAVIRSSLRFAETFPQHDKAVVVMAAAVDDIYGTKDFEFAAVTGRKLLVNFPNAEPGLRRGAWLVVAHSSYELARYGEAEEGYVNVLELTSADDESRNGLIENLAASIYKQGEEANVAGNYRTAAGHFLRVGQVTPGSKIRSTADYDGAVALMKLEDWDAAADVLLAFRQRYPGHELQPDVTKKIAHVYHEAGKLQLAAAEYERIETETDDEEIRREALLFAAELYVKAANEDKALVVYRRYVKYFPRPLELMLDTRHKVAEILKSRSNRDEYLFELRQIVGADANAGQERTDRTRYLGAISSLVLTEPVFTDYAAIALTQPFEKSLPRKRAAMKTANDAFGKLVEYGVGDVTAAATYYIAEVYFNFSVSLRESERPRNLDDLEAEMYEEMLDEQSYPFEEKAIEIHEKNIDLVLRGVYNNWIDKSMQRLASLMPGRYAKPEVSTGFMASLDMIDYQSLTDPQPPAPEEPAAEVDTPVEGGVEDPDQETGAAAELDDAA
jgi:cellulose synthase operon protein C